MRATRRQVLLGTTAVAAAAAMPKIEFARAADQTTIEWWHISQNDPGLTAFQDAANAYMADHPDVKINVTVLANEDFKAKLATVMQGGSGVPDMFQSWGGGVLYQYADAGLVRDITADLAKDDWGTTFNPAALGLYANNGKNYGVPWDMGIVGMWYNKSLFTKAGIDAPPTTWDELLDDVKKLQAAKITPIAVGEGDKWPGHFWWVYQAIRMGGKSAFDAAYTRQGKFTDQPFIDAGTNLKALIDLKPFQDGFLAATYNEADTYMANGNAAMELMGQWLPGNQKALAENKTGLGDDLGFFPFPGVDGGAGQPTDVLGGCDGFAFSAKAPDAALDFARYITARKVQTDMAGNGVAVLPTVNGADSAIDDPNLKAVAEALKSATYLQLYYDQFLPPAVGGVVNDATQQLFAGTASPEEIAQTIEDSAAQELAS